MPNDQELLRLLQRYAHAEMCAAVIEIERQNEAQDIALERRAALLAHIDREYVRRDANRLPASAPGSYKAARGAVPRQPGDEMPEVAIRRLRDSEGDDGE